MKVRKILAVLSTVIVLPLMGAEGCKSRTPAEGGDGGGMGPKARVTISGTAFEKKCWPLTLVMYAKDEKTGERQDLTHVAASLDISYVLLYDRGHPTTLTVELKTAVPNCTGWVKVDDGPANTREEDIIGSRAIIQNMRLVR